MLKLMIQKFFISTKCQAYPRPLIRTATYRLNIFFSEITGHFDGVFIKFFLDHLTKMAATPYMVKQNMFHL